MKTRFGKFRLGYLWAVLEPLSYVLILSMIRMFFSNSAIGGIDHPIFYTVGIMPFLFFQHSINVCLCSGLQHRAVQLPADPAVHRAFTRIAEAVIMTATGLLVAGILCCLGFQIQLGNPLAFPDGDTHAGFVLAGLGLLFGVLSGLSNEIQKIVPIFMRPLFFISGIFFMPASIPEPYKATCCSTPCCNVSNWFTGYVLRIRHARYQYWLLGYLHTDRLVHGVGCAIR